MAEPSNQELERLIAAAQGGDEEAMQQLLAQVQPLIYRFGMRVCRDPSDAEDVLQETLLTIARKLRSFRGASSLSTWAYTVARNHCIKQRRRQKAAAAESCGEVLEPRAPAEGDPLAVTESREAWQRVAGAIARLDPERKEVLVLRDVEGLSAAEVAEVVGVSVPAVKSRLHRARRELREVLGQGAAERREGCPDIVEMFSKEREGELTAEVCQRMQRHVDACLHCSSACDALKEDLRLCQLAPSEPVPQAIQERIAAQVRKLMRAEAPAPGRP